MAKYVDKSWRGERSRYTVEQIERAVPAAMRRYAKGRAKAEGRQLRVDDFHLFYREPSGDVNFKGIRAALAAVDGLKGPSLADKASAKAELLSEEANARRALGMFGPGEAEKTLASLSLDKIDLSLPPTPRVFVPTPVPFAPDPPAFTPEESVQREPKRASEQQLRESIASMSRGGMTFNTQMLQDPNFRTQRTNLMPDGVALDPAVMLSMMPDVDQQQVLRAMQGSAALAAAAPKKMDVSKGAVDNDYRPLPNYRRLGITRAAGPATADEMRFAKGHTKYDGSPMTPEDYFSAGAELANTDIIPQLMAYIPRIELIRIGAILALRAKKSDEDHSRKVMSGHFTIVNPLIGEDPNCKMHLDHPLLGKEPYTALLARLLFPIQTMDPAQMAAVEAARVGRLQNLSITFGFGAISCALCGDMQVTDFIESDGQITGFRVDSKSNSELFAASRDEEDYYYRLSGILRSPAKTEGGFVYKDIEVLKATEDGIVQIDPMPKAVFEFRSDTAFMLSMDRFYSFFGMGPTYCRLHGRTGNFLRDGRRCIGMFTNMRALINTAAVDAGAINDARIVLDPDIDY